MKVHLNTSNQFKFTLTYRNKSIGINAIVFTAGLGENNIELRKAVCDQLEGSMGVKIDYEANNCRGDFKVVSSADSKVKVLVIPTNEELVIARDTIRLLGL